MQSITWFRRPDNNPIVIDSTVIDSSTFSRSLTNLPPGHHYGANANALASYHQFGQANTENVMYSALFAGSRWLGLVADDVNMVKMADTGSDRLANTADDYQVVLAYTDDCSTAQVEAFWDSSMPTDPLLLGLCEPDARLLPSFSQTGFVIHRTLTPPSGLTSLLLGFNPNLPNSHWPNSPWDYAITISFGNFEIGGLSEWSAVSP